MKRGSFYYLKNKKILEFLIREENLPKIGQLAFEEAQKLIDLNKIKDGLDFGEEVDEKGLEQVLLEVKEEVDSFLEVDNISVPECIYYNPTQHRKPNVYHSYNRRIITGRHRLAKLVSIISHEYTHHVQKEMRVPKISCSFFKEGHARGVQRHITHTYMEREGNEAFLYDVTKSIFNDLMRCYEWLCKELKHMPEKKLKQHSGGSTFMYLQENAHGKNIYKDFLKNPMDEKVYK